MILKIELTNQNLNFDHSYWCLTQILFKKGDEFNPSCLIDYSGKQIKKKNFFDLILDIFSSMNKNITFMSF